MSTLRYFFIGALLGVANIIPGVSGGTMAVATGTYDMLLDLLGLRIQRILHNKKNLACLAAGIAAGVLLFCRAVEFLLARFPMQTNFFFIGLVIGCLPGLYRKTEGRFFKKPWNLVGFVLAAGALVAMELLAPPGAAEAFTALSPGLFFALMGAGFLAAVAMVIPGVSGSFMLLLMGLYPTVIGAVSHLRLLLLIPFGLGCLAGLIAGARVIRALMRRAPVLTYSVILGLVAGSVAAIWPGFSFGWSGAVCLLCLAAGAALSFFSLPKKGADAGPESAA